MKKSRIWIASLLLLAVLVLLGVSAYSWYQNKFSAPRKEAPIVQFKVSKQNTIIAVVSNLSYYGFIKDENAFKYALQNTKDTTPGKEGAIKIGNNTIDTEAAYDISPAMSAWEIAKILLNEGTPTSTDCSDGCPIKTPFEPELLPGGNIAPSLQERLRAEYDWVKNYEDCVKAHGQLSSEQYAQRTGKPRECVNPDSRVFTQGQEGWSDRPSP